MILHERRDLPPGFFEADGPALARALEGPTLIHLEGERERPLFVTILSHGNEVTGLSALQSLLGRYRNRVLPRSLCLFVANTDAAAREVRRLPGQPDWNRIWPLSGARPPVPTGPETALAGQVRAAVAAMRPFAVVDVHNNNGDNPHYACINRLEPRFLQLARRFGRRVLYFTEPPGTLTHAFADIAPAVTLECGPVGDAAGAAHAARFLDDCLHLDGIPDTPIESDTLDLYQSAARLTVPAGVSIGVGTDAAGHLRLPADLETRNWREQLPGTLLATTAADEGTVFNVTDTRTVWLRRNGDRIELAHAATPAMLTVNPDIVRQDCFGYLLTRLPVSGRQ